MNPNMQNSKILNAELKQDMNLLFLSDVSLGNPTSGSEQVLNQQAVGLSRKGLNVFAITRAKSDSRSVVIRNVEGVKEGCYYLPGRNILRILCFLFKKPSEIYCHFIRKRTFIFSVCHQPFTCMSLIFKRKLGGQPFIYVFHSPSHEEFLLLNENRNALWKFPLAHIRKMIEGYCLRKAQKIVVLSEYMKSKIIRFHKISDHRIIVNPGGADLDRFKPVEGRSRVKTELGYLDGKIHLLTIRNLEPRMGLDNLLMGFSLLIEENIPVQLIIGGEGPEKEKLRQIIEKYGLKTDVTLTGFIPPEKLPQYYGAADFFVLPTRNLEGFGLVTTESMACGTPVLGTPVGATKEILNNFDSQFLFQDSTPESIANGIYYAINIFFKDEQKYSMLRTRCREFVAQYYSWQRHIDTLEAIIYELSKYDKIRN
jgi:glycosyltransferase involved in cell wall biosynthesis